MAACRLAFIRSSEGALSRLYCPAGPPTCRSKRRGVGLGGHSHATGAAAGSSPKGDTQPSPDQVIIAEAGTHAPGELPAISYVSGGLEEKAIRDGVCSMLEDGEEAFRSHARPPGSRFREIEADPQSSGTIARLYS